MKWTSLAAGRPLTSEKSKSIFTRITIFTHCSHSQSNLISPIVSPFCLVWPYRIISQRVFTNGSDSECVIRKLDQLFRIYIDLIDCFDLLNSNFSKQIFVMIITSSVFLLFGLFAKFRYTHLSLSLYLWFILSGDRSLRCHQMPLINDSNHCFCRFYKQFCRIMATWRWFTLHAECTWIIRRKLTMLPMRFSLLCFRVS